MESYERIKRTFAHQETDRVPILDSPWAGTIRRWQREGMPADMDWRDYFDVDKAANLHIDISPRYESKVLEEIRRTVPYLKRDGGYIFASDHSIPNDVSLETMKQIIAEVKRVGTFYG